MLISGCIRRSLTIRTDPARALVYVNDELKGKSPVTYDFMWYGWHRVMIRKDGYARVDDRKLLTAPVYLWIPLDLVMELLPFPIRDRRTWSYTLAPTPTLPTPVPPAVTPPKTPSTSDKPSTTFPLLPRSTQIQTKPAEVAPTPAAAPSSETTPSSGEPAPPTTESTHDDAR
ncbi:MAG: PEGA domain-containing protein [Candidatus Omnitrophica bacterium]|nr:PEGA domain-containing protein [Candidatus Omnitrophota bacterium]